MNDRLPTREQIGECVGATNDCPRPKDTPCPACGARIDEDCPLGDLMTPRLLTTPAVGAVRSLSSQMLFTLALFRDRPDELIWQRDGWMRCFFGLVPFIQVPMTTVKALAMRGLIIRKPGEPDGDTWIMVLSDAGKDAARGLAVAWNHEKQLIELQARWVVADALKRAVKGTRRKAAA